MARIDDGKLAYMINKLRELEYGTVTVTVHDGEITQIESTEKKRFPVLAKQFIE